MAAFASPTALLSCSSGVGVSTGVRAPSVACSRRPPAAAQQPNAGHLSRRGFGALLAAASCTALGAGAPQAALAEKSVATMKRAYERYYPRIKTGGDELRSVGEALQKGDVAAALAVTESKEFDVKFRRALSIYATSFSDSTLGQQSLDLLRCQSRLFDELAKLKGADQETIVASYNISCEAYEKYVKIARLPKELLTPAFPKL